MKNFYYSFLASIYLSVISPILVLVNLLGKIDVIKEKMNLPEEWPKEEDPTLFIDVDEEPEKDQESEP